MCVGGGGGGGRVSSSFQTVGLVLLKGRSRPSPPMLKGSVHPAPTLTCVEAAQSCPRGDGGHQLTQVGAAPGRSRERYSGVWIASSGSCSRTMRKHWAVPASTRLSSTQPSWLRLWLRLLWPLPAQLSPSYHRVLHTRLGGPSRHLELGREGGVHLQ